MSLTQTKKSIVEKLAMLGLTAKGIVYSLLGILAFMAAFEIGGFREDETSKSGVLNTITEMPGGTVILLIITIGLICYSAWRILAAVSKDRDNNGLKRVRYFFSALIYLALAYSAIEIIMFNKKDNGDTNEYWAKEIISKPFGEWLLGATALFIAGVGIYQLWYGLSEKYKKHVNERSLHNKNSLLLTIGKIGYVARGIVWLLIAFLLFNAAIHANPSEAGDTGKAFRLVENNELGSLILAAIGLGLVAYGLFCFVRAKYEKF